MRTKSILRDEVFSKIPADVKEVLLQAEAEIAAEDHRAYVATVKERLREIKALEKTLADFKESLVKLLAKYGAEED